MIYPTNVINVINLSLSKVFYPSMSRKLTKKKYENAVKYVELVLDPTLILSYICEDGIREKCHSNVNTVTFEGLI